MNRWRARGKRRLDNHDGGQSWRLHGRSDNFFR
jgi:hypothetical protein